jgi:hypothetical protein
MSKFHIGDTVILKRPTIFTAKGSLEKGARGLIVNVEEDERVLKIGNEQFCVSWFNWDKGHSNTQDSPIAIPHNSAWWVGINALELDAGVEENE